MKLIENMSKAELGAEMKLQLRRIDKANAELEKIHGTKDYSDELAKHFHLGKVGFRKDTKRQARTLDRAIDNGVRACGHYEEIESAKNRIHAIERAVNFIVENRAFGETVGEIKENQRKTVLESAKTLKWDKVTGQFGAAYQHGEFVVERVDAGFVAVRDLAGNLLSHYKTVKDAKAAVSIAIARA
jgi:hypothetical protein